MTDRFLRDYILTIGIGAQAVVIRPPFRIAFSADKSDKADLNKMTLRAYNLNDDKRRKLVRDADDNDKNVKTPSNSNYFPIELKIGYQGKVETIFRGSIDEAGSVCEGAEFITTMTCLDGGHDFIKGFVSTTVTSKNAAIDAVLKTMPSTAKGKIGAQKDITRPKVLVGNSMATVQDMLDPDQRWFIDDERLNILGENEVVSGYAPLINAETGLIAVESDKKQITFTTMLNPSIKVGGLCMLQSVVSPHLNGVLKVSLITYVGDTDGNDWQQKVTAAPAENYKVPR